MKRFDFGKNWISFSRHALIRERIELARNDFQKLFEEVPLEDRSFLDIGFGQGLAILFASEAGSNVVGCDINPRCCEALQKTSAVTGIPIDFPVITGSILSDQVIAMIQKTGHTFFDIVHSWGVLHHTGDMAKALTTACNLTGRNGHLVLAIYNKHWSSPIWKIIKRTYCSMPVFFQNIFILPFIPVIIPAKYIVTGKNPFLQSRGMDFYHDVVDWIGGYPYEYSSVETLKSTVEKQGFKCINVIRAKVPTGCNQYIFKKCGK